MEHSAERQNHPRDLQSMLSEAKELYARFCRYEQHGKSKDEFSPHRPPSKEVTVDTLHQLRLKVGEDIESLTEQDIDTLQNVLGEFLLYLKSLSESMEEGIRIIEDILGMVEAKAEKVFTRKKIKEAVETVSEDEIMLITAYNSLVRINQNFSPEEIHKIPDTLKKEAYLYLKIFLEKASLEKIPATHLVTLYAAIQGTSLLFKAPLGKTLQGEITFGQMLEKAEKKIFYALNSHLIKGGTKGSAWRPRN